MTGWQTIETAPKDGTAVLVALQYHGKWFRYVAHRKRDRWMRDEENIHFFPDHMQDMFSCWMPLPLPPVDKQDSGDKPA